jgi:PAS domain S-box-containing protein
MSEPAHILYMEDNEGTARLLEKRFERAGYLIDIAPNGEKGLERYTARSYDAIIIDYNMPGLSGLQVIQRLAELGTMPPTIMLTGTGNERIAVEALKLGAFDYVVKDIDGVYLDLLPTVIEQALKNQQLLEDKRHAEKALRESEKRFRSVIEQSLDGIALVSQDGVIVEWNHAEEEITNVRREEAVGQCIWDMMYRMLPPEARLETVYQSLRDTFNELLRNRKSPWLDHVFEYEMVRPDGERRTVQAARFLIDLGDHFLVGEISRDISERKWMENALRESEERFRMLFEEAPDPYFVTDLAGNLINCNRAVASLLGLDVNELLGKNFADMQLFIPAQLAEVAEKFSDMSAGAFTRPNELTITRPDGSKIEVDLRVIPIQTKGQTRILGIGHDITWRKQAGEQMQAHIRRLETLSRIDDVLMRHLDIQYAQTMALESMIELSEANAGSIALIGGTNILSVYSVGYPEELNQFYFLDGQSIVARVARQREAEWVKDVTTDPDYFPVTPDTRSQITIPLISQERLIGIINLETNQPEQFTTELFEFLKVIATRIAVAIDNAQLYETSQRQLVELQILYEKVSKLEQLKTDMIRLAAHDLRNPLSNILTKTYLLRKTLENQLSEKQQNYVDSIDDAVGRMQTMINDFLSVERIEITTEAEEGGNKVDLQNLAHNVFASYRGQARKKSLVYHLSSPRTPLWVKGFEAELQQVISNLIGNAIKYTPEGGSVEVSLVTQNLVARFEVIDSGYGIPLDQQDKLFQPFFRAKMDETKSIDGTGLGLYLVKKFIERNGGEIIFDSEPGKGSTFGFALPIWLDSAI